MIQLKSATPLPVQFLSPDELKDERDKLVARSGLSLAELRHRAATYDLSVEQGDLLDVIEDIEFLLATDD